MRFLYEHSHLFVKGAGAVVPFPHIKCHVITAVFARKADDIVKYLLAHVLSAAVFVNADIVYKQRFEIMHICAEGLMLEYAERISDHLPAVVCCNKHRCLAIRKYIFKLFFGVFCCSGYKYVRSQPCVKFQHLVQKNAHLIYVARLCAPDLDTHFLVSHILYKHSEYVALDLADITYRYLFTVVHDQNVLIFVYFRHSAYHINIHTARF